MSLKIVTFFVHFLVSCTFINSLILDPDPSVLPTKGAVWPNPQQIKTSSNFFILNTTFEFQVTGEDCKLLQDAVSRYSNIILMDIGIDPSSNSEIVQTNSSLKQNKDYVGFLNKLDVRLTTPCKGVTSPEANMKEEYVLVLTKENGENYLTAPSIWGVLRGLETFSQLIYKDHNMVKINSTYIHDFPRFPYRGLLIDTARHFIPMNKLLSIIDGMAYNKLNVFHWHITDDKSFPYVSKTYPELSKMGAYTDKMTYLPSDVRKLIEYASARGVRVIPEFDTPGHTRSWGKAFPELLTPCYKNGTLLHEYGPMDPTQPATFKFMKNFLEEITSVFPDTYIHLGADEVRLDCWENNARITEFMKNHNLTQASDLEQYYLDKVFQMVNDLDGMPIVWEDVYNAKMNFDKSTIVHVWMDPWNESVANITQSGYPVLLSAGFYLDYIEWGGDWLKFYYNEPTNFTGTDEQKKLVVGGEACMWSESVNEYNIESRIWPRASAIAERLWSPKEPEDYLIVAARLEEHACRMNKRGIGAQPPNGAGFCIV